MQVEPKTKILSQAVSEIWQFFEIQHGGGSHIEFLRELFIPHLWHHARRAHWGGKYRCRLKKYISMLVKLWDIARPFFVWAN